MGNSFNGLSLNLDGGYPYAAGYYPYAAPVTTVKVEAEPIEAVAPVATVAATPVSYAGAFVHPYAYAPYAQGSQFHAQDEFGNLNYGYTNINSAKQAVGNTYGGVTGDTPMLMLRASCSMLTMLLMPLDSVSLTPDCLLPLSMTELHPPSTLSPWLPLYLMVSHLPLLRTPL